MSHAFDVGDRIRWDGAERTVLDVQWSKHSEVPDYLFTDGLRWTASDVDAQAELVEKANTGQKAV
mgnify:CR=1 FL=1